MTWATAPAIATDVANTTLSVVRYTTRNTMVERKSVKSRANTSFIVMSPQAMLSVACSDPGQRIGGGRGSSVFRLHVRRVPFGEIGSTVAGRECNHEYAPQRPARHIAHPHICNHHRQESARPSRGD